MAKLTKRAIDALMPDAGRPYIAWDDVLKGFGVRVWPSGRKSYLINYRNAARRQRQMVLGDHGKLTPDGARRQAMAYLAEAGRVDPLDLRQKARTGETLSDLAKRYLAEHANKKKPSSAALDQRLLELHLLPALGRRRVAELTRADVARFHHSLRATPTTANRAVELLRAMLNLAEQWGLRPDGSNPCRHIKRYAEKKRERFLSADELGRLGDALAEAERTGSQLPGTILAVRLLAFSGMRRTEVLTLKWEYVNFERACIHLPDSKTGRKTVPLGAPALDLLAHAPRTEGNPYVCTGDRPGAPLVGIDKAWARLCRSAGLAGVPGVNYTCAATTITLVQRLGKQGGT
jgi:integrase